LVLFPDNLFLSEENHCCCKSFFLQNKIIYTYKQLRIFAEKHHSQTSHHMLLKRELHVHLPSLYTTKGNGRSAWLVVALIVSQFIRRCKQAQCLGLKVADEYLQAGFEVKVLSLYWERQEAVSQNRLT